MQHERAGSDERLLADLDARQQHRRPADARATSDRRALDQLVPALGPTHQVVVRRDDAGRDEDVIFERAVRRDVGVGLQLAASPDRGVVLDRCAAPDHAALPDRHALAHDREVADDHARGERGAGEHDRSRRDRAALADHEPRQCSALRGRGPAEHGALAEHRVVADERARPDPAAVVDHDVGAEADAVGDLALVADVQVEPARVEPHSAITVPPASSERCIASSTSTTARPSRPLAIGVRPSVIASTNSWHSIRSGSLVGIAGIEMPP